MSKTIIGLFLLFPFCVVSPATARELLAEQTEKLRQIIVDNGKAHADLVELTKLGHRLSGSAGNERAVKWAEAKMKAYGLDRVWLQPVEVPRWERGSSEHAEILGNQPDPLRVAALGNSPGTGDAGITAEVVEVKSLKEVESLGSRVKGKIVFYNRPMEPSPKDSFEAYGRAVDQRTQGPTLAARYGAVATLVRSMTSLPDDDHPHTGMTSYRPNQKIPAAALSTKSANALARALSTNAGVKVKLQLSAREFPNVTSYNVIGEIKGSQPDQIVLVGGHLDSWDLSPGAHDDGAGVVQSIEVLRAFKEAQIPPKRTLRAVLFAAEEIGGVGGAEYAKQAHARNEKHLAAIESDRGGFAPVGFAIDGSPALVKLFQPWTKYLSSVGADLIKRGGSGSDVGPLSEGGTLTIGYLPDGTHYFDVHHSEIDTIERTTAKDINGGAAAMAILVHLISESGIPSPK